MWTVVLHKQEAKPFWTVNKSERPHWTTESLMDCSNQNQTNLTQTLCLGNYVSLVTLVLILVVQTSTITCPLVILIKLLVADV